MGGCCSKAPRLHTVSNGAEIIQALTDGDVISLNSQEVISDETQKDQVQETPSEPQFTDPGPRVTHWTEGARYVGEFRNGIRHGRGAFDSEDGSHYDGEWADDARHGRGVFISAAGDAYDGDFARDEMHGRGELRWACGDVYRGDFRRGRRDGDGELTWAATGDHYKGGLSPPAKPK